MTGVLFAGGDVSELAVVTRNCLVLASIRTDHDFDVQTRTSSAGIGDAFLAIQPLRDPCNRTLLIQTTGNWTALFCNGLRVPDVSSATAVLSSRLRVSGIHYTSCPSIQGRSNGGWIQQGALRFAYFGRSTVESLLAERTVHLLQEDARWTFFQEGVPLWWEEPQVYTRNPKVRRFSSDALRSGLVAHSIRVDEEAFYQPRYSIVTSLGWPSSPEYTLCEARRLLGLGGLISRCRRLSFAAIRSRRWQRPE